MKRITFFCLLIPLLASCSSTLFEQTTATPTRKINLIPTATITNTPTPSPTLTPTPYLTLNPSTLPQVLQDFLNKYNTFEEMSAGIEDDYQWKYEEPNDYPMAGFNGSPLVAISQSRGTCSETAIVSALFGEKLGFYPYQLDLYYIDNEPGHAIDVLQDPSTGLWGFVDNFQYHPAIFPSIDVLANTYIRTVNLYNPHYFDGWSLSDLNSFENKGINWRTYSKSLPFSTDIDAKDGNGDRIWGDFSPLPYFEPTVDIVSLPALLQNFLNKYNSFEELNAGVWKDYQFKPVDENRKFLSNSFYSPLVILENEMSDSSSTAFLSAIFGEKFGYFPFILQFNDIDTKTYYTIYVFQDPYSINWGYNDNLKDFHKPDYPNILNLAESFISTHPLSSTNKFDEWNLLNFDEFRSRKIDWRTYQGRMIFAGIQDFGESGHLLSFEGEIIDETKWDKSILNGATVTQDGQLILSTNSHEGSSSTRIKSKWFFSGDFDIQVDFQLSDGWEDPINFLSREGAVFGVTIDGQDFQMIRLHSHEDGSDFDGITAWSTINPHMGGRDSDALESKLRLIRNGTTLLFHYYDPDSGWDHFSSTTVPTGPAFVYMGNGTVGTTEDFTTYFDNFMINSGDLHPN